MGKGDQLLPVFFPARCESVLEMLADMRHRASTALWGMNIRESQIDGFMEHIGHQKQMDKNVYACPPALRAKKTVTPLLEEINRVSLVRISLLTVLFSNIYIFDLMTIIISHLCWVD